MNYEKKYNEALERARKLYEQGTITESLCYVFPELIESEDERVRKELLSFFTERAKYTEDSTFNGLSSKEIISWLEKQGKQKPAWNNSLATYSVWVGGSEINDYYLTKDEAEKLADKYRKNGYDDVVVEEIEQKPINNQFTPEQANILDKHIDKFVEQKPQGKTALEAINEEKVDNANKVEPRQEKLTEFEKAVKQVMEEAIECGDTRNLKADAEMLLSLVQNSAWSEDDELHIRELESLVKQVWTTAEHENDKDTIHKMSDLSFFLKTLKPQPKQEWSEEDGAMWTEISDLLWEGYKQSGSKFSWDDIRNWVNSKLKSLRPQKQWKPSDEQMRELGNAKDSHFDLSYKTKDALKSLYKDLKKLKG